MNPLIVFLAVMFWGWIWGIVGVILAVPITMVLKIIGDHNSLLAPYTQLLTAPRVERLEATPEDHGELAKGNA